MSAIEVIQRQIDSLVRANESYAKEAAVHEKEAAFYRGLADDNDEELQRLTADLAAIREVLEA